MRAERTSYWFTVGAASLAALGGALAARALRALPEAEGRWLAAPLVLIAVLCLAVVAGGAVCLWRDGRESAGRPDIYAILVFAPLRTWWPGSLRWLLGRRLRPGDRVRVKSYEEIAATLDTAGSLESLPFMEEMKACCGRTFEVYRSIDKINDMRNKTGLRRMRRAVTLTAQRCSGGHHDGCQAGCLTLWKEAWLKRLDEPLEAARDAHPGPALEAEATLAGKRPLLAERVYRCQMTSLWEASEPMSKYDIRQDLRPLLYGNIGLRAWTIALLTRLFGAVQGLRGGTGYPRMPESRSARETPTADLQLQPGEAVVVRSKAQIAATLYRSRNRGLWFDREQVRYCAQPATVLARVDRVIHEGTGKMVVMKTPCAVLRETVATGEFLRCCVQHEHVFWREAWLARAQGSTP
jgi:hypothetical protein